MYFDKINYIASEALCANEIFLAKSASFFLTAFITTSREKRYLLKVIEDNGQFLVMKIIYIISKIIITKLLAIAQEWPHPASHILLIYILIFYSCYN